MSHASHVDLKLVPPTETLRRELQSQCRDMAATLDKSSPLSKQELESMVRRILAEADQPEGYVGWCMVALNSAFWWEEVAAVPYSHRLLFLPRCPHHDSESCTTPGCSNSQACQWCRLTEFRHRAEKLGYQVLVAEGSPQALQTIVDGPVNAILGVADLNVLERAVDALISLGVPALAVPLLSTSGDTQLVDEEWVAEMIDLAASPSHAPAHGYLPIMRSARVLFQRETLDRLAPPLYSSPADNQPDGEAWLLKNPLAATEALARDFLIRGGKYARPFITLAVYAALCKDLENEHEGPQSMRIEESVERVALSIETFHKASLVHDDIEDDDGYRYGQATLHRAYGIPTAINVGDYLIGLGYRLVSRETPVLGAEVVADILGQLSDAHLRLSQGQGAELTWRDGANKLISVEESLEIYALKTAPAFEAALHAGFRLACPLNENAQWISAFTRHLGIAFQILNDLKDWREDASNKVHPGGDVFGGRPTVLWATALATLPETERAELESLAETNRPTGAALKSVHELYLAAGVFEKARSMVEKHRREAIALAESVQRKHLRRLLLFLVDTVLEDNPQRQFEVSSATRTWDVPETSSP